MWFINTWNRRGSAVEHILRNAAKDNDRDDSNLGSFKKGFRILSLWPWKIVVQCPRNICSGAGGFSLWQLYPKTIFKNSSFCGWERDRSLLCFAVLMAYQWFWCVANKSHRDRDMGKVRALPTIGNDSSPRTHPLPSCSWEHIIPSQLTNNQRIFKLLFPNHSESHSESGACEIEAELELRKEKMKPEPKQEKCTF